MAQVLAWVYQLRDALAAGRTLATEAPVPEIPADLDPQNAVHNPAQTAAQSATQNARQEPEL